jgi:outer membrane protein OmpA-like peptidoglycan-associated protein
MPLNLLSLAHEAMGEVAPGELAKHLGESPGTIAEALKAALPAVLGALVHRSQSLNAAGALLGIIDLPQIDGHLAGKTNSLMSDGAINFVHFSQMGTKLMLELFSERGLALVNRLATVADIKASSANDLASVSTVLALSLIKRVVTDDDLGAAGLMAFMQGQGQTLLGKIDPSLVLALGAPDAATLMGLNTLDAAQPTQVTQATLASAQSKENRKTRQALLPSSLVPWIFGVALLLSLIAVLNACDLEGGRASRSPQAAPGASQAAGASTGASTSTVLPAVEKIYFDAGKYESPDDTSKRIANILSFAKNHGNSRLTITGFHDTVPEAEPVLRLARQRSMAVRSVLISAGITEDRIVLKNAQEAIATVGERQATRVEVSISP